MILAEDGVKMSKSRGNVINPDDIIAEFGADTLRVYEMFIGPYDQTSKWSIEGVNGVHKFLNKLYGISNKISEEHKNNKEVERVVHQFIKETEEKIEKMSYNTIISSSMEVVNIFLKEDKISKELWEKFLLVFSIVAPFISEELWNKIGNEFSIHSQKWPIYNEKKLETDQISLPISTSSFSVIIE